MPPARKQVGRGKLHVSRIGCRLPRIDRLPHVIIVDTSMRPDWWDVNQFNPKDNQVALEEIT
jgi:hypothetical protein